LHRTVARQCGKINSKLLDDGTSPTSQRLLPPATTYYMVQCCREISLPLISITRLLPLATTHARGCSTSQTIIIMATEVSNYTTRHLMNRSSTPGRYL
jgi:hypothetical protein